jgi:hypothetical protein
VRREIVERHALSSDTKSLARVTEAIESQLKSAAPLQGASAVDGSYEAFIVAPQRSSSSANGVRTPRAVLASESSSWAARHVSRVAPWTVRKI